MYSVKPVLNILRNRGTLLFSNSVKDKLVNLARNCCSVLDLYRFSPAIFEKPISFYNLPMKEFNIVSSAVVQFKIDPSEDYDLGNLSLKFQFLLNDLNNNTSRWEQYLNPNREIANRIFLLKLAYNSCKILESFDFGYVKKAGFSLQLSSLSITDSAQIIFASNKFHINAANSNLLELYDIFKSLFEKLSNEPEAYKKYLSPVKENDFECHETSNSKP